MVCVPCRRGVHLGDPDVRVYAARFKSAMLQMGANHDVTSMLMEVCQGGTWCDCQHRPDVPR